MGNLFYTPSGIRVKIIKVFTSGLAQVRDRDGIQSISFIGDLKRVY